MKVAAAWVADHELWPLALGVGLVTLSARLAPWGLALLAALWLVRFIGRGRPTIHTPLDWPALLLLLTIPATFYATTDVQTTFAAVARMVAGLALAYGLVNYMQRGAHVSLVVLGLAGTGLGLAFIAPITVGWFTDVKLFLVPSSVYQMLPTLVSDTIHPNMIAGALTLLLPFPLALLIFDFPVPLPPVTGTVPEIVARWLDTVWLRRLLGGVALFLMLGVLFLTKSRGGWIAAAVVVLVMLVRRWRYLLGLIPILLVGLGVLGWRGELKGLLDAVSSGGAVSGWEGRIEIWSRALYMIGDFALTGIGMGTFNKVANALYPFFLAGPDAEVPHAHNLLLQVAVDLGYPGLIAFVSILLVAFWCGLRSVRHYERRGDRALAGVAWAGMAGLIGMLVHGLVDATAWAIGRGAFIPWAIIGVLVALNERPSVGSLRARTHKVRGYLNYRGIGRVAAIALVVALLGTGGYLTLRGLQQWNGGQARPAIRLPLYPASQGADVRIENPPVEAGWVGQLEVATFTTTHPISDVVAFYTGALAEAGWETNIQAGDAESWGGIYTRDGGHSVCLLNAFVIEGEVWCSIVCGDKTEPVE